jgi:hypothetical protein
MSKRYPGGIIRKTPQTPTQKSAQGIWDMASVTQAVKENNWPIADVPNPISKSLRFRSSASASLSRTPSSASNRTTWTWSGWIKRGDISTSEMTFFSAGTNASNFTAFAWNNNNLFFQNYTSGSQVTATSTAVFRDPSAWYHVVLAIDTTQGTASNRAKLYVNGVQQAGFSGSSFSSSQQFWINFTYRHTLSARSLSSIDSYTDQYMAEVNFVDGQALTPSSFGTTDDNTGIWEPIAYTGSYGTNGFYLPFSNTTSTTTLGYDFSGNSNNWTPNNISLTSGSTYDSMVDVPTRWIPYNTAGDTGALWRGNYCTLNPLDYGSRSTSTFGGGNLNVSNANGGSADSIYRSTFGVSSGKWYFETTFTQMYNDEAFVGIARGSDSFTLKTSSNPYYVGTFTYNSYYASGVKLASGSSSSYGASWTANDVIGVALDLDAGTLTFYKNNSSQGTAFTGLTGTWFPTVVNGGGNSAIVVNFGQRPFAYTPPTGFVALNTFNLPTPTIGTTSTTQAVDYFDATTYTGTGSSQLISNSGSFQPNFVWIKQRSAAGQHNLMDVLRTGTRLRTDDTAAENDCSTLFSFASTGFNVLTSNASYNQNTGTYVAWQWKASDSGVSNTSGSITSTVSANTSAGFSIVTYTGNGTIGATVGHGLGVAPSMFIVKQRSSAGESWATYHISLGATKYLDLNGTAAASTSISRWNNTAPTTTVFSLYNDTATNGNSSTYVAYCFAQVAGYSAFGSYTGNASTDGPFVFTGFNPKFLIIKNSTATGEWHTWDSARSPNNVNSKTLRPNNSNAETDSSDYSIDFLSNGFKVRNASNLDNQSGQTFIYMAFAENPFKYALAR